MRTPISLLLVVLLAGIVASAAPATAAITTAAGTTGPGPTAPPGPFKVRAKSTCGGALLTWTAPKTGDPVTSYNVYRSSDRASFALLDSTTTTSYTDTTGGTKVRNYYRVIALNDAGEGTPTRARAATMTCGAPADPLAEPGPTLSPTTSHFSTLRVGSTLPSDATCATEIHAVATATAEPRPANTTANHTVPPPGSFSLRALNSSYGYDNRAQKLETRVTGNFTGTTDQIIQWASCKWGWDEDVVRAIAVSETNWQQGYLGDQRTSDCPPGYSANPTCPHSFGIHQVMWNTDPVGNFPWARDSTAFNLDVSMMIHRVCFEGYTQWLKSSAPNYAAGDMWGCVGQWYSGYWHDAGAQTYTSQVKQALADHAWTASGF